MIILFFFSTDIHQILLNIYFFHKIFLLLDSFSWKLMFHRNISNKDQNILSFDEI